MLDFDKLAAGLREALAKETTETVDKWFQEYDNQSIQTYLGNGVYSEVPVVTDKYRVDLASIIETSFHDNLDSSYSDNLFSQAA